jgi:UDP-N-acetylmuramoyl-L-alanyl-D-glutamate--2,6-diaminopimelate ligase
VENPLHLSVYVDYAHKEDALRKVLSSVSKGKKGKLIVVFGCGGDRDKEKRPCMAKASEEWGDHVIVTSDNPRSEDPSSIIEDIVKGFTKKKHLVIPDRKMAILQAIELATTDDIVIIAGKGHEKKQIFRHATIPFDDCQVALECCKEIYARKN